jgi:hypothetical protein
MIGIGRDPRAKPCRIGPQLHLGGQFPNLLSHFGSQYGKKNLPKVTA